MKKVVYILGAGFSAPLGLPVMSNFFEKSKDQYDENPEQFAYFSGVFAAIEKLHKANTYYETNMFNIEDILSILEFRLAFAGGKQLKMRNDFLNYIKDVIEFYTPDNSLMLNRPDLFVEDMWQPYINFVAAVLGCGFVPFPEEDRHRIGKWQNYFPVTNKKFEYSVITLNYDHILDHIAEYFIQFGSPRMFSRKHVPNEENAICLAKLHGSVKTNDIIPPTWNKGLEKNLSSDWQLSYKLLSEANYIRILGYSLPNSDSYMRYFLSSTVIDNPNLNHIGVLCLDDNLGSVQRRYEEFVKFKNFRFVNKPVSEFLDKINICYQTDQGASFHGLGIVDSEVFG